MGPLERNKDDLLHELSSAPAPPGSPVVSSTPQKSPGAVIAAVIPAVANLLSNIWTNSRNEELAEQQNEWNLQQWRRENAYNDPRSQLARLLSAGINPALAYANGNLMNEAASSPQMTSAAGMVTSPVQIDPLTAAQVANLDAQTQSIEHQTIREDEKQPVTLQIMGEEVSKLHNEVQAVKNSLSGISADSDRKSAEAALVESTLGYAISKFKYESLMTQDQYSVYLQGLMADLGLKKAQIAYTNSLKKLSDKQAWQVSVMTKIAKAYLGFDTARFKAESPYLVSNASSLSASLRTAADAAGVEYKILSDLGEANALAQMLSSSFRDVGIGFGQGLMGIQSLRSPAKMTPIGFMR